MERQSRSRRRAQGLSADWDITITPLDTCGLVTLDGARYQRILNATRPRGRDRRGELPPVEQSEPLRAARPRSTQRFFLTPWPSISLLPNHFCKMERLGIRVTDDGFTVIDDQAKQMDVATEWTNLDGFRDLLVNRLCGPG